MATKTDTGPTTDLHILVPADVLDYVKREGKRIGLRPAVAVRAILTACMASEFSLQPKGPARNIEFCEHGNNVDTCPTCEKVRW